MSRVLLDVNVLIAMSWPAHICHRPALQWFATNAQRGWVTCPITEAAFVRILSNPSFSRDALTPHQALALLKANTAHPRHQFWPDDLPLADALKHLVKNIVRHQQVTDAYLLAVVEHHRGALATFDKGIPQLARGIDVNIELIGSS